MKKISFLFCAVSLFACRHSKADLVDMQKKYADSAKYYDAVLKQHMFSEERMKLSATEAVRLNQEEKLKAIRCQEIVDSLEWELKKY